MQGLIHLYCGDGKGGYYAYSRYCKKGHNPNTDLTVSKSTDIC